MVDRQGDPAARASRRGRRTAHRRGRPRSSDSWARSRQRANGPRPLRHDRHGAHISFLRDRCSRQVAPAMAQPTVSATASQPRGCLAVLWSSASMIGILVVGADSRPSPWPTSRPSRSTSAHGVSLTAPWSWEYRAAARTGTPSCSAAAMAAWRVTVLDEQRPGRGALQTLSRRVEVQAQSPRPRSAGHRPAPGDTVLRFAYTGEFEDLAGGGRGRGHSRRRRQHRRGLRRLVGTAVDSRRSGIEIDTMIAEATIP